MWKSGNVEYVGVVVDPNNPDCVTDILPVELGTGYENTVPFRDSCGYLGYIINGKFIYAQEIPFGEYWEIVRVECAKFVSMVNVEVGKAQVPVVSENIVGENAESKLSEIARKQIEGARKSGELGCHISLENSY